jgi:peptidyl-tRNA hydrolase
MPDKPWKVAERRIARLFGVERNALSGGNSKITRSDSLHRQLYIESKWGSRSSLWTLYKDTKVKAKLENKIPILSICLKSHEGSLLVVHVNDLPKLLEIYKEAQESDVRDGPILDQGKTQKKEPKSVLPIVGKRRKRPTRDKGNKS